MAKVEVKELIKDIRCEMRAADKYAREALKHKEEYPELAPVYARIASDKLEHANMLYTAGKDMLEKHGDSGMKMLWHMEHEFSDEDMMHVKRLLAMYRG